MLKHKTSVLFASSNSKDKRSIQIPTTILLNWRKYFISAVVLFALLGLVIGFFIYDYTSQYYTNQYKEKIARVNKIKNEIDIEKAKASFQSVDESMQRINKLLQKRGIKPLKYESIGGPIEFDLTEINQVAEDYANQAKELENLLRETPLGKPHFGKQTSSFGKRSNPFGGGGHEGHSGIDLRGDTGAPIHTTADGKVVFAGQRGGYGNCIIIQHANHLKTLYGHLSKIEVRNNQKVTAGQVIGRLGSTGRSTGPHVHYEVMLNDTKVNPQNFQNL